MKTLIYLSLLLLFACAPSPNQIYGLDYKPNSEAIGLARFISIDGVSNHGSYFYKDQPVASYYHLDHKLDLLVLKLGKSKKLPQLEISKSAASTVGMASDMPQSQYTCRLYQDPLQVDATALTIDNDGITASRKINDSTLYVSANFYKLSFSSGSPKEKIMVLDNDFHRNQDAEFLICHSSGENFLLLLAPQDNGRLETDLFKKMGR